METGNDRNMNGEFMNLRNGHIEIMRIKDFTEGSIYKVPIVLEFNLIPGEILPILPVYDDIQFVEEWSMKKYPFGVCNKFNTNYRTFGTIATLSYIKNRNWFEQIKVIPHQRFEVLEVIDQSEQYAVARIKIMKETTLFYPLNKLCLHSKKHSLRHCKMCFKRDMFQTQWPSWVYKQFDIYELASEVKKKMNILGFNTEISNPITLSFKLTTLNILDEAKVSELLGIESTNLRLQCELHYLNELVRTTKDSK